MKVLFLRPQCKLSRLPSCFEREDAIDWPFEPISLELVASGLFQHHDVDFIDLRLEPDVQGALESFQPDVVAIGCLGVTSIPDTLELATTIKSYNPRIITVIGGIAVTLLPDEFNRECVDFIVLGEGDISFRELIEAIEKGSHYSPIPGVGDRKDGKIVVSSPYSPIIDLDELPLLDRTFYKKYAQHYQHPMYGGPAQLLSLSRGCNIGCKYCAVCREWGARRCYSIERAIQEIERAEATRIRFLDDDFLNPPDMMEKIGMALKEANIQKQEYFMHSLGGTIARNPHLIELWRSLISDKLFVQLHMESIGDSGLRKYNKTYTQKENEEALRILIENDAVVFCSFLLDTDFTRDDFRRLFEYIEPLKSVALVAFVTDTPMPNSSEYRKRYQEFTTHDLRTFDCFSVVLPTRIPLDEFYEYFDRLWEIGRARMANYFTKVEVEKIRPDFLEHIASFA